MQENYFIAFCIFWTNDVVDLSEGASAANILSQLATIKPLDGTNYSTWKEDIELMLGLSELDYALNGARPVPPQVGEPDYDDKFMKHDLERVKWERSNRKYLMILKRSIMEAIRGSIPECETAREYMDKVAAQFVGSSKAYASTLTKQFINMRYDGSGIRAYIQKMCSMVAKMSKYFKTALPDKFVVHVIMQSLPKEYETFHVNYNNTVKDQWTLDQLMAQCVQEEERIKARRGDSVNLAQLKKKNVNSKPSFKKPGLSGYGGQGPSSGSGNGSSSRITTNDDGTKNFPIPIDTCLHCKKKGYYKRDCPDFLKSPLRRNVPYKEGPSKGPKKD